MVPARGEPLVRLVALVRGTAGVRVRTAVEPEHRLVTTHPCSIETVEEIPERAPVELAGGPRPEPEQTRVARVLVSLRHDLADRALAGVVQVVEGEEIEPLPLAPGPRGVAEHAEDVFLVGPDEPGQGRVGCELLADAQLGVHLGPVVVDAERIQVPVPPPFTHLLELLPPDLEGVSAAEDILNDVPREAPGLAPRHLLRLPP